MGDCHYPGCKSRDYARRQVQRLRARRPHDQLQPSGRLARARFRYHANHVLRDMASQIFSAEPVNDRVQTPMITTTLPMEMWSPTCGETRGKRANDVSQSLVVTLTSWFSRNTASKRHPSVLVKNLWITTRCKCCSHGTVESLRDSCYSWRSNLRGTYNEMRGNG